MYDYIMINKLIKTIIMNNTAFYTDVMGVADRGPQHNETDRHKLKKLNTLSAFSLRWGDQKRTLLVNLM